MDGYRLTDIADKRLADIYAYSLLRFGKAPARTYFLGLHEAFNRIVAHPELGRLVEGRSRTRRLVHRRHSIFYEVDTIGVLILDILGAGQDPELHDPQS
ncbi:MULTISPECIES: type II toxin-antitoxin system RelE/ParE family toxin [unclassified Aureimonas]|uniref:type II toxin-antitoxin system RelE/ParE family toxin n=1 Tax=unclassified Aureimonas TaxID=2615206 RepID=UPI0006FB053C|nr:MULTISPECIES: type II toxin-antitoxin system RelE/ParE family toxin [unclassified Aureimonas]KQT64106.1 hypothetical protein ASG62_03620 [Aureimonas sp. Leaf427]KQT81295.1 hypothetical protein ASG54_00890 [Aureimonas sp. Leaf460]